MEITIIALATLVTFGRVLFLMLVAILSGWILGYIAIKNRVFENAFVLFISVFESIPVFSFIPIILLVFIRGLGGSLGVEVAADFLVFTAIVWNIWIGIYQAFKTVPEHLLEVSANYELGFVDRIRYLYIPFSIPRIAGNIFPSFSDALFYITVSEVFTVGASSYQTFGIGTVIAQLTAHGNFIGVYYSLLFIAVGVIAFTFLFSNFSKQAIAKYGIDTSIDIRRRKKHYYYLPHWLSHGSSRAWYDSLRTQTKGISKFTSKIVAHRNSIVPLGVRRTAKEHHRLPSSKTIKYLVVSVVSICLIFILYSAAQVILSVPKDQWINFLVLTPYLLYAMAADYVRVLVVTAVSLVLSIFLGYYLTVHKKAIPVSLPLIQIIAAFPVPAYFPFLYAITSPYFQGILGDASTEFYVLLLCFISTFYYVLFNFWVGIQAIPTEFWELMRNYELKTFTRLRRVILPATFPYLIAGLSSTVNSAWGGLAIVEYWNNIYDHHSLHVQVGMMKIITSNTANGNIGIAAWTSLLFAIVVIIFGLLFTRNLMDLARKKYVVEEGIYAA